MTTSAENYLDILERICTETIAPQAIEVDRQGAFPAASMEALRDAGLSGVVSAPEVGGLGLDARAAASVGLFLKASVISRSRGRQRKRVHHFCGISCPG